MAIGDFPSSCPHCGYCPHCGRSNQPYVRPYSPWGATTTWWGNTNTNPDLQKVLDQAVADQKAKEGKGK